MNTHSSSSSSSSTSLSLRVHPGSLNILVVVLLLSAPEVQLLVDPPSQLSVHAHIVLGPHIQPLVQHCSPVNADVIIDNVKSVHYCAPHLNGVAPLLGFPLPLCPPPPQHHSSSDPSSETQ